MLFAAFLLPLGIDQASNPSLRSLVKLQVSAAFAAQLKASDHPFLIPREHKAEPPFGDKLVGYRALEKRYLTGTFFIADCAHSGISALVTNWRIVDQA